MSFSYSEQNIQYPLFTAILKIHKEGDEAEFNGFPLCIGILCA